MATTGQPIAILLNGIRDTAGAVIASGKVRFYSPGTLSASDVYSDNLCTSAITQPITLNAGGQKLYVYTKTPLRMIVKESTDTTTILDVDPVNVVRAEQLYMTVAGINGGAETTLHAYLSGVSTFARSVKDPAYGALGDDSNDDTAEIQAALTAITAAGGGLLVFPPGVYKITDALTVGANTWIYGAPGGSGTSGGVTIKQYTSGINGWLTTDADVRVDNINLAASNAAHTGRQVSAADRVVLTNCTFGSFAGTQVYGSAAAADIILNSCRFNSTNASALFIASIAANASNVEASNCVFLGVGGSATFAMGSTATLRLTGCRYKTNTQPTAVVFASGINIVSGGSWESTDANGVHEAILCANGATLVIGGVHIVSGIAVTNFSTVAGAILYDLGNSYAAPGNVFPVRLTGTVPTVGQLESRTRVPPQYTTGTATGLTPDAANFATNVYRQTAGAAFALANPSTDCMPGQRLTIIWHNASGSNITPTMGTAYSPGTLAIVNNGQSACWEFIKGDGTGTTDYIAVSPQTVFTP